jgi:pyruvate/oxaloacetate carboxyltransferase
MPKVNITDVILRDAHQSLIATRMRTEDMLPICPKLDAIGYWSLECWGGATFDACVRFLKEDPWERLRKLREALPNTRLQMLLRGQNLLGYRHYSDDVVRAFVKRSAENGMDVFRIFDALNDLRNLRRDRGDQGRRQARPGHHLLHHQPGARHDGFVHDGQGTGRHGLRLDRHQGHGRAAHALCRRRSGQGD